MPRIRTIKPEFQNSQSMGRISREARLTFVLLWPQCDDAGRIRANSRMLASVLFPYDEDASKLIEGWLSELEKEGCVVRYTHDRDEYLAICHWDHQKIDHPQPSKLPAPQGKKIKKTKLSVREQQESVREPSLDVRAVSSIKDQGMYQEGSRSGMDEAAGFGEFYELYPHRVARRAASKAYRAALSRAAGDVILSGAMRYAIATQGKDRKYVKHPATWLNSDCWMDDDRSPEPEVPFEPCDSMEWRGRMKFYFEHTEFAADVRWRPKWGPIFSDPTTKVPQEILAEFKSKMNGSAHDAH